MKYLSACPSVYQSTFKTVPLALLDLSAAFNTVVHCILFLLCHHCASYDVGGAVVRCVNCERFSSRLSWINGRRTSLF